MFEPGARVTIMHMTIWRGHDQTLQLVRSYSDRRTAAENAWDQKIGIRATRSGIRLIPDMWLPINRQADRYMAMTEGPYLWFSGSLGESCNACAK